MEALIQDDGLLRIYYAIGDNYTMSPEHRDMVHRYFRVMEYFVYRHKQ